MILDRGIARFYKRPDADGTGNLPTSAGPIVYAAWYGDLRIGVTRYYTARAANDRVDRLIRVTAPPPSITLATDDTCVLDDDGRRYRLQQIQALRDDDAGEDVLDISLERIGEKYESN